MYDEDIKRETKNHGDPIIRCVATTWHLTVRIKMSINSMPEYAFTNMCSLFHDCHYTVQLYCFTCFCQIF